MKFSLAFLAVATAAPVFKLHNPFENFTPKDHKVALELVRESLKDASLQVVNSHRKLQSTDEGFQQFKEACDNPQVSREQLATFLEQGLSAALPPGAPPIDGTKMVNCLCSDNFDVSIFASDDGISSEALDVLCTDDCQGFLEVIFNSFLGALDPTNSIDFSAILRCVCNTPAIRPLLAGGEVDESDLGIACAVCSNEDCVSLASLDPSGGGADQCSQIPDGFCASDPSSPPPPISMAMAAGGSVADYTDSVKTTIKTEFASFMTQTGIPISASDVSVDVAAASRRLSAVVARRLSENGVTITLSFAPPAGVSTTFVASQMENTATQNSFVAQVNTALPSDLAVTSVASVSAESGGDDPCFPSSALVTRADGTKARMDALRQGEFIVAVTADGKVTTDAVSMLSIAKPADKADFYYSLETAQGHRLNATSKHHIPVGDECCSNLKQMKDVAVGETVWLVEGKAPVAHAVTKKTTTTKVSGLHSPVLAAGHHPVVDGFVTAFDSIHSVTAASYGLPTLLSACAATGTCEQVKRIHAYLNGRDAVADYIA